MKIQIKGKVVDVQINRQENTLSVNGQRITEELLKEFEEQVLGKPISNATDDEVNSKVQELGQNLNNWIKNKDAWLNWKKWAEDL